VPAQVVQLIDVQILYTQEVLNVFHYVNLDGAAEIAALEAAFPTEYIASVKAIQTGQLFHTGLRTRRVYPTADLVHETIYAAPVEGTDVSDALASCDALSMKWALGPTVVLQGGFAGHLKRGGMRLPGAAEDMVTQNSCTTAVVADWAASFLDLSDPVDDGSWLLCVASYLDGARVRQPQVQSYSIVLGSSAPSPSTQNTRKVLRGRVS
jgi:hypothetical protein